MNAFVTRFAPSPTGLLHLGHAFSALSAWDAARAAGGRLLLRIEDIDQGRCRAEYEDAIYEDLAWLGVEWEAPVRRQSGHMADYAAALDRLRADGLVYRCFKTRKEVADEIARAPHLSAGGPEGPPYIGAPLAALEERGLLAQGAAFAWRLSMDAAQQALGARLGALTVAEEGRAPVGAHPEMFGDFVIARKDSGTSYHLASVWDDALQGVTHVIRGEDLRPAAHLHRLLQELLGLPAPVYIHHRIITGEDGKRLSKRDRAMSLRALRETGATPDDVRARLGLVNG